MSENFIEFSNDELSLPFTVDDLFTDEDYDLVYGKNTSTDQLVYTENIIWCRNLTSHTNEKGDEILKVAKGATGLLRNRPNKLSRVFWEWVNDTYHEDWIGDLFKGGYFENFAPVSILVWNDNSPWHMEPGETDANILKNIQSNISTKKWWGPWWRVSTTVCNFRLLGDDKNSTIHFADITDEFYNTILDTRQKFYDKWIEADSGFFVSAVNDENFPTFQSYGDSDQIINVDAWHNHMTVKEIKNGFESPFMLNLGNVHRVFVGDQSTRVTFRLHSSKKLDWITIKQYRDTGVLLK